MPVEETSGTHQGSEAQADTSHDDAESAFTGAFSDAADEGNNTVVATPTDTDKSDDGDAPPPDEGEGEPEDGTPDDTQKAEDWEQKYKTLQGMFNKLKKEQEAAAKAVEKDGGDTPKSGSGDQGSQIDFSPLFENITSSLPKDLQPMMAEYERDMDIVSKIEGAKRDAVATRILTYVHKLFDVYSAELQPYLESVKKVTTVSREDSINRAHADYKELHTSGEVKEWIESQPSFLRDPMMKVYDSGDAADVIELISRYKKEAGKEADTQETPKEKNIDPKIADRVKSLQIVKNKQKGVNAVKDTVSDPDDFSAAFREALANIK